MSGVSSVPYLKLPIRTVHVVRFMGATMCGKEIWSTQGLPSSISFRILETFVSLFRILASAMCLSSVWCLDSLSVSVSSEFYSQSVGLMGFCSQPIFFSENIAFFTPNNLQFNMHKYKIIYSKVFSIVYSRIPIHVDVQVSANACFVVLFWW